MGQPASKSESTTLNMTEVSNNIQTLIESTCRQNVKSNVDFTVRRNYAEGDINISNNKIDQNISFDGKCLSNMLSEDDIKRNIEETLKSQVKSKAELFGAGTEAKNINTSITNLSTEIATTFINECMQEFQTDVKFLIEDNTALGTININGNQVSQAIRIAVECINENKRINKQVDKINKEIATATSSESKGVSNESMMSSVVGSVLSLIIVAFAAMMVL